ncbi:NAD(P)-binding protein [Aspergillus steynii IBT 23096]|uniref:NAD(P)-binding protein n=1 Tax=Aspergillus steynii IBT 23096 TaxID=1392250 RepID=A0A2I2GL15_9EURO|nr:NAD(P)-binding protein [Aspergillus steynii IBT 23096]PLB53580.1 NAD(P)-binding protein [Aspergillus steynii IBT 23096]
MSTSRKLLVVVGATGNQGSSVAKTFLKLDHWDVRCVTRNASSAAARKLASLGAGVVEANLADLESLRHAFANAHAIFVNTDFWALYLSSPVRGAQPKSSEEAFQEEVLHGQNAAIAAAEIPTLERFVYSALGPMKKHSHGKYPHSYHWDSKATIVEYIEREQPSLARKASFIYPAVYATNPLFMPTLNPSTGQYQFLLPLPKDLEIPIIDPSHSTGPFVRALVENERPGVKLLACDASLTIDAIVKAWNRATGRPAELVEVSTDYMHRELGIPREVLDAPPYIAEFGYMGGLDNVLYPKDLAVKVQTPSFTDWLEAQNWQQILDGGRSELTSVLENAV